jgi:hypothetical protein
VTTSPVALALAIAVIALAAPRAAEATGEESAAAREVGPEVERAIRRGLEFLARPTSQGGSRNEYSGAIGDNYRVASTSLAGLAILAGGTTLRRGDDRELQVALDGCLRYILTEAKEVPGVGIFINEGEMSGRMHSHGFATLFLCQVYGTLPTGGLDADRHRKLRRTIRGCLDLIVAAQTTEGGWGYHHPGDRGEWGDDEASVTITQIQALRAGRNAGFHVDAAVIERAIDYVKKCANPEGDFKYSLKMGVSRSSFELTAAAVSTLNASGVYASPELERGLAFMRREMLRFPNPAEAASNYFYYGNLYAAQAMNQAGGKDWSYWYPRARDHLVRKQAPREGSWDSDRGFGKAYATSIALLILQIPYRYLPIFER